MHVHIPTYTVMTHGGGTQILIVEVPEDVEHCVTLVHHTFLALESVPYTEVSFIHISGSSVEVQYKGHYYGGRHVYNYTYSYHFAFHGMLVMLCTCIYIIYGDY